ncbi:hypothetical protein V6N12_000239 [Hibiscus sabdariffa]|uniref:Uncharacterized protein n=1 Tax=Hibiscus sabdariffa TaxID=183260 RepID=A0ABR1ZL84_9ROSI
MKFASWNIRGVGGVITIWDRNCFSEVSVNSNPSKDCSSGQGLDGQTKTHTPEKDSSATLTANRVLKTAIGIEDETKLPTTATHEQIFFPCMSLHMATQTCQELESLLQHGQI